MDGTEMFKKFITGIIYTRFDEKIGPKTIAWMPSNLSIDTRNRISLKSMNILTSGQGQISNSFAIIPFPSLNLKGLIKCFEIKDKAYRGGGLEGSLTLLFSKMDDPIFYKYSKNFEPFFNETIDKIIQFEKGETEKERINEEIQIFYRALTNSLEELREVEFSALDLGAFPMAKERPGRNDLSTYKIIVCGDPMVGKTSIVLRFIDKSFRTTYFMTTGVNISEKLIRYENVKVEYALWDIGGQSKFERRRRHFYGGANGQLLIFDLTRPDTFENISRWFQDIKNYLRSDVPGIIVGNKSDMIEQRKVNREESLDLANQLNLEYVETSALTGKNIDEAFYKLGSKLRSTPRNSKL